MADDFKQNEDVLHLAKFLIAGIVLMLVLATIFAIIDGILTPNSTAINDTIDNLWGALSGLFYFIAFLSAIYGLLYQMAKDDSNVIRFISLIYALSLLSVLILVLFPILVPGVTFVNPLPTI